VPEVAAEERERAGPCHERPLTNAIEEGLEKIVASCGQAQTTAGRLWGSGWGRLLGQELSGRRERFEVQDRSRYRRPLRSVSGKESIAGREWARLSEGCYVLRSQRDGLEPRKKLWRAYMQLTEAEAAFPHPEDGILQLRPIWAPETRAGGKAHILVCFLAFVLVEETAWRNSANALGWATNPRKVFQGVGGHHPSRRSCYQTRKRK